MQIDILLAVESADVRSAVSSALKEDGHRVLSATDGDSAARIAIESKPRLVVTTPDLPRVRGAEVFEIARRAAEPESVAGVFLLSPTDSRAVPDRPHVRGMHLPVGSSVIRVAVQSLLESMLEESAGAGGSMVDDRAPLASESGHGIVPEGESVAPSTASSLYEGGASSTARRGPGPQETGSPSASYRIETGSLRERSLPRLLFDAKERKATGFLAMRAGEAIKRIHILHGRPVNCDSSLSAESLPEMLLADKLLSQDDLEEARDYMLAHDTGQSQALVAIDAIDHSSLAAAMGRHARERILTLFSWDEGDWRLDEVDVDRVSPLVTDLEPLWLVVEGVRRYAAPRTLLDFFDDNRRMYPIPAPSMAGEAGALMALMGGARVLDVLDGRTTLGEMQAVSGLDELSFYHLVFSLRVSGLVTMDSSPRSTAVGKTGESETLIGGGRSPQAGERERPASGEPYDGRPDSADGPFDVEGVDPKVRDEILGLYTCLSESDPFDLLGVEEDVDAPRAAAAFADLAARVGPDRISEAVDSRFARLARDVWLRIEEAYSALADDESRARWRAERKRGLSIADGRRVRWLDADRAFHDGRAHLDSCRFSDARKAFEAASDLNRRDPVYRLYVAWAGWLEAKEDRNETKMDELEQRACGAVEAIPILEEGWLFLGEMALHRSDEERARALFEKALLFNPGSRNARDALERLEADVGLDSKSPH